MKQTTLRLLLFVLMFSLPVWIVQTTVAWQSKSLEACIASPSGLIGWWAGDGNANDKVDNNDGIVGSGASFVAGMVGQAFSFDGSSGHINIPNNGKGTSLDGFSLLTVEAWVYPDTIGWQDPESGGNIAAIVSKHDTTKTNGVSYSLLQFNGKLRFVVAQSLNPDNAVGVISDNDIPLGTWSHVAAVWRGGTDLDLYLNGAEMAATLFSEGTTPTSTAANSVPVNIGRIESFSGTHVGPAAFFDGQIDEVAIFNRDLSAGEIQAIYNAGSQGKCKSASSNSSIVYLPMIIRSAKPLLNGDFEKGATGWGQYSTHGWELIRSTSYLPVQPHSGNWATWLGGDDDEINGIWQEVTIPSSDPILQFWMWIASADICGYDVAGVVINLDVVVDAFWLCDSNNTGGWIRRTVDLSDYAGQTVDFDITASNDSSWNSNLFIDDVSLGSGALNSETSIELQVQEPDQTIAKSDKMETYQLPGQSDPSFNSSRLDDLLFQTIRSSLLVQDESQKVEDH